MTHHQLGWLYKLITWNTMDPAVLPEVMNRITFVDAFEISRVRQLFPVLLLLTDYSL
jgi:hypothetical protein